MKIPTLCLTFFWIGGMINVSSDVFPSCINLYKGLIHIQPRIRPVPVSDIACINLYKGLIL